MIISYTGRLFCVVVFMAGLIHLLIEGFLWSMAPFVLRTADALATRQRERLLYGIQLVPVFATVILTCAVCIPQYVRSESNFEPESVSLFCFAGAVAVGFWYCFTLIRGFAIAARTVSFVRSCRQEFNEVAFLREDVPIRSYPGKAYSVALVGLFQPFILISESLLGEGGLSAAAVEIVLDHEVSHARQLDNWKLFSLYCLPGLQLRLRNGQTWNQMWQSAAEWAADDDAVRSDNTRVLVLAETLVAVARRAAQHPNRVCMALASGEADLAVRVSRLIDGSNDAALSHSWSRVCGVAVALGGLVGAMAGVMLSSHTLLERLIHLGQD
jgi:hypothetical protein